MLGIRARAAAHRGALATRRQKVKVNAARAACSRQLQGETHTRVCLMKKKLVHAASQPAKRPAEGRHGEDRPQRTQFRSREVGEKQARDKTPSPKL